MANAKLQVQLEKDQDRKEKVKNLYGQLSMQQADMNKEQRQKKKKWFLIIKTF